MSGAEFTLEFDIEKGLVYDLSKKFYIKRNRCLC